MWVMAWLWWAWCGVLMLVVGDRSCNMENVRSFFGWGNKDMERLWGTEDRKERWHVQSCVVVYGKWLSILIEKPRFLRLDLSGAEC